MQPHNAKPRRKPALRAHAKRLRSSGLGWIDGYPLGDKWFVVPRSGAQPTAPLSVDRALLRRSDATFFQLRAHYADVLGAVVGDTKAWGRAIGYVLSACKSVVHDGASFRTNLFDDPALFSVTARETASLIGQQWPQLNELLGALSWYLIARRTRATSELRWLRVNGDRIATLCESHGRAVIPSALRLCALGGDFPARSVDTLVQVVAYRALSPNPTKVDEPFDAYLGSLGTSVLSAPNLPAPITVERGARPNEVESLFADIDWLARQPSKVIRRYLALLATVDLPSLAARWQTWWESARHADRQLRAAHATIDAPEFRSQQRNLAELRQKRPVTFDPPQLLRAVRTLSAPANSVVALEALPALKRLRAVTRRELPAAFATHWANLLTAPWVDDRQLPRLLRNFARHLSNAEPDLSPWTQIALRELRSGKAPGSLDTQLLNGDYGKLGPIFEAFQAFGELSETPLAEVATTLVDFVAAGAPPRQAGVLSAQLAECGEAHRWHAPHTVRLAVQHSEHISPRAFPALLKRLTLLQHECGLRLDVVLDALQTTVGALVQAVPVTRTDVDSVTETAPEPAPPKVATLLTDLLLMDDVTPLIECAQRIEACRSIGGPTPVATIVAPTDLRWLRDFPVAAHGPLHHLAYIAEDACAIAKRAARNIVPDRTRLTKERTALLALMARSEPYPSHLDAKLDAIERQLDGGFAIPPRRLRLLVKRLERATLRALVGSLTAAATARLHRRTLEALRVPALPDWIDEPENAALLVAISRLNGRSQRLGFALLRARCSTHGWDFRNEEANATFLRGLDNRAINTSPWIGEKSEISLTSNTPRGPVRLTLERDPLEVLRMGGHFGTCLGPNDMNFFSAVSNAVDINKQVLYARNEQGKVIGRRLLSLTDRGEIVSFRGYSHHAGWQFDELSRRFIRRLADAMRTVIIADGPIRNLVCDDWYDDGAVDVDDQLAFLKAESDFMRDLRTLAASEFVPQLMARTGSANFEAVVLPRLVGTPILERRPELAHELVKAVVQRDLLHAVAEDTLFELALLLDPANAQPSAIGTVHPGTTPIGLSVEVATGDAAADLGADAKTLAALLPRVEAFVIRNAQVVRYRIPAQLFLARHRPRLLLRLLRPRRRLQAVQGSHFLAIALALLALGRHHQARSALQIVLSSKAEPTLKEAAARQLDALAA